MGFIILLILTTLSIAGSAAYFSVVGLARVFTGAFWSVVFMGSSLEAGKLITASYLYRHWKTMSKAMKAYLFTAVIALMCITSMGIFGYLSSAFESNVMPYKEHQQQIQLLEADKAEAERLKAERLARGDQINKQIANLPNDFVRGRSRLMAANKDELDQIRKDIADYTNQIRQDTAKISEFKGQVLQETAHVGPIIFMAQAFGADVNQATKWLIIIIICVFDPLAVVLTVGTNAAILEYKRKKADSKPSETTDAPAPINSSPVIIEPIAAEDLSSEEQSEFQKAHDLFNKPVLTQHEQTVKAALEQTIKRYSTVLKGNDK